jgi:hypothetical protein
MRCRLWSTFCSLDVSYVCALSFVLSECYLGGVLVFFEGLTLGRKPHGPFVRCMCSPDICHMYLLQVAEHVLFDLPGVLFRRSLDEVRRHHVRKFDLVMANHTLSELCNDKERQQAVRTRVCARGCRGFKSMVEAHVVHVLLGWPQRGNALTLQLLHVGAVVLEGAASCCDVPGE